MGSGLIRNWSVVGAATAILICAGGTAGAAPSQASKGHATASDTAPGGAERPAPGAMMEGARLDGACDRIGAEGDGAHGDPRADRAACRKLTDADIATAPIVEVKTVTHHQAMIDGRMLAYTATAGTLTVRDDAGKPILSTFYVAYTLGDGHDTNRPVTFFYNGGPGSSTMWLQMGSLAPRRVATDSPEATKGPPFHMVDNAYSLIDKSDLVFMDAPGAGYSRPLGDTKLSAFWGTDADIDAFARGIERYLTIYDRWNSPKVIFGESYGTTRSAGLSYRLQQDGVQLNGVVLLSSILNYGRRNPGFDQELINYMPSYAAIAAYYHRAKPEPADLKAFLAEVRDFARGPYAEALAEGDNLTEARRQAIAQKMSAYTGLSVDYLLRSDLRVEPGAFRAELLRDQRLTLGRYDARFNGEDMNGNDQNPEYDPSDTGITGAFVSSFHHYITDDLGYQTDLSYRPTYYQAGLQWDFKHRPPRSNYPGATNDADVALDLSAAIRENPNLEVYSLNGMYDLATPFFGTEYDLAHMELPPRLLGNVHFAYYPSGHMVYLNVEALKSMKADLSRFYDQILAKVQ